GGEDGVPHGCRRGILEQVVAGPGGAVVGEGVAVQGHGPAQSGAPAVLGGPRPGVGVAADCAVRDRGGAVLVRDCGPIGDASAADAVAADRAAHNREVAVGIEAATRSLIRKVSLTRAVDRVAADRAVGEAHPTVGAYPRPLPSVAGPGWADRVVGDC